MTHVISAGVPQASHNALSQTRLLLFLHDSSCLYASILYTVFTASQFTIGSGCYTFRLLFWGLTNEASASQKVSQCLP